MSSLVGVQVKNLRESLRTNNKLSRQTVSTLRYEPMRHSTMPHPCSTLGYNWENKNNGEVKSSRRRYFPLPSFQSFIMTVAKQIGLCSVKKCINPAYNYYSLVIYSWNPLCPSLLHKEIWNLKIIPELQHLIQYGWFL